MSARHRLRRDTPSWRQARRLVRDSPRPPMWFTALVGASFLAGALALGTTIAPPDDGYVVLTSTADCGVVR